MTAQDRTSAMAERLRARGAQRAAQSAAEPPLAVVKDVPEVEAPTEAPEASPEPPAPVRRPRRTRASVTDLSGLEGRLEAAGEPLRKLTMDLPRPVVDALARWELDHIRETGKRPVRERVFDRALSALPDDVEDVIAKVEALPAWLRQAETEQTGIRARESLATRSKMLQAELRVRRVKGVYLRHVYAAALLDWLRSAGVKVTPP